MCKLSFVTGFLIPVFCWRNATIFLEITSEDGLVWKMQLVGNFLNTESGKL